MKVSVTLIAITLAAVCAKPLITQKGGNENISAVPHTGHKEVHSHSHHRHNGKTAQANLVTKDTETARVDLKLDTEARHPNATHSLENAGVATAQAYYDLKDQAEDVVDDVVLTTKGTIRSLANSAANFVNGIAQPIWDGTKWVGRQADNTAKVLGHSQIRMLSDIGNVGMKGINTVTRKAHEVTEDGLHSVEEDSAREYALLKNAQAKLAEENQVVVDNVHYAADKTADGLRNVKDTVVDTAESVKDTAQEKLRAFKEKAAAEARRIKEIEVRKEKEAEAERQRLANSASKKVVVKDQRQVEVEPAHYEEHVEERIKVVEQDPSYLREQQKLKAQAQLHKASGKAHQKLAQTDEQLRIQAQRTADALARKRDQELSQANARLSASAKESSRVGEVDEKVEVTKTETLLTNKGANVTSQTSYNTTAHNGTIAAPASSATSTTATLALGLVIGSAVLLL